MIATTGEGEAPTTMQENWRFLLRKDLPSGSLGNVRFTVFGLGDSSYELFNAMAKKLTQRLIDLGATLKHKVGLGDYQHDFGYEGEFDPWVKELLELTTDKQPTDELLPPVYSVEFVDTKCGS